MNETLFQYESQESTSFSVRGPVAASVGDSRKALPVDTRGANRAAERSTSR